MDNESVSMRQNKETYKQDTNPDTFSSDSSDTHVKFKRLDTSYEEKVSDLPSNLSKKQRRKRIRRPKGQIFGIMYLRRRMKRRRGRRITHDYSNFGFLSCEILHHHRTNLNRLYKNYINTKWRNRICSTNILRENREANL